MFIDLFMWTVYLVVFLSVASVLFITFAGIIVNNSLLATKESESLG